MYSLYDSLLAQHPRQLTSVRCAPSTILQLHRYFEEVVLENSLGALVVESIPRVEERPTREATRLRELAQVADRVFLFLGSDDVLSQQLLTNEHQRPDPVVLEQSHDGPKANIRGALVVAERLLKRLISTQIPGYGLITASFGVASFPLHASSRDLLVLAADRALYESKHAGRNRISFAASESPSLNRPPTPQVETLGIIQ